MATYQNIKGLRVKYLSADPGTLRGGEVWYNSTTGTLKGVVSIDAWSSASPVITARRGGSMGGTQTATIISGGNPGDVTSTEEYNGSGWSAGGALNTGRTGAGGAGLQTSALVFGGTIGSPNSYQDKNESYDGTSWTEEADLSTARYNGGNGAGTQTSALYVGGYNGSNLTSNEEWNGTSWTAGTVYPTGGRDFPLIGTLTATLGFGGYISPGTPGLTNSHNGSSWTTVASMNTGRATTGGGGTQTAAIGAGGYVDPSGNTNKTETYDGTSWTETADMATARRGTFAAKSGSTSAFLNCAGKTTTDVSLTEEFNVSSSAVTAGAWAAGGNLNTSRTGLSGAGSVTAGVVFGGTPPTTGKTEEYNGTSWTENPSPSGDMGTARYDLGGFGTQVSAVAVGGGPATSAVEEYGGTTWTAGGAIPSAYGVMASTGTTTAGLIAGGNSPAPMTDSWEYNGTGWAASPGSLNTGRQYFDAAGTQTSAVAAGGWLSPGDSNASEEYNGTVWASGNNIITARRAGRMAGVDSDSAILYGGQEPGSASSATEGYDGTNWSTRPSLATARRDGGRGKSGSTATSAFLAGGSTGSPTTATEEFTGATSVATASTLTTS